MAQFNVGKLFKFKHHGVIMKELPSDNESGDEEETISDEEDNELVDPTVTEPELALEEARQSDSGDSDSDSDDEANVPLAHLFGPAWDKNWELAAVIQPWEGQFQLKKELPPLPKPAEFFTLVWPDDICDYIISQTNLYIQQKKLGRKLHTSVKLLTKEELRRFLGIILYSSIVRLSSMRDYWAAGTRQPFVADVMTKNRFLEIVQNLHFNDNYTIPARDSPQYDKLYKIRPIVDKVNAALLSAVDPEEFQSVDEMMVKFTGKHSLKQYMPGKPIKYGYKLWSRCGSSGYVYWFEVYEGARPHHPGPVPTRSTRSGRPSDSGDAPSTSGTPRGATGAPTTTPKPKEPLGASVIKKAQGNPNANMRSTLRQFKLALAKDFVTDVAPAPPADDVTFAMPGAKRHRRYKEEVATTEEGRYDQHDHFGMFIEGQRLRCKFDSKHATNWICNKCGVHLCHASKPGLTCFYKYHKREYQQ